MKSSTHKDTAVRPREEYRHDMIFLPSKKDNILSYQFKLPMASINQYPRKNKYQLQYRLGKSWICDTTNTVNWLSPPNSSLEYDSFDTYKSMSSRSAKIMRALSSTHNSFRNESVGIRKSLNFDSPSPKKNSSYDESSVGSINTNTPSSILNSSPINSTDSNVPIASVESIDENQNKTPQQNRRHVNKSSNRSDTENIRSRTSHLMSLLEKKGNEGINRHANHRLSSRVITTSTPRNLAQEFNQELGHNRPHTPENVIDVIPESISAIKKSHKKEKWHCYEEQLPTQRMDISLKNDNFDPTMKSSETNIIVKASCSSAAENESQKKNKNIKRTLIYNDKGPDARLDFNRSIQRETMMEDDLLASGLDQTEDEDEMQNIKSNKNKSNEESMQVELIDNDEKDLSKESICDEEVSRLSLQRDSGICNISENRIASPGCNSSASRDASKVVTPENDVNMLKHVLLTESIKKSHKKMKHASRKTLLKTKNLQKIEKKAELEMSIEDVCNDDQDTNSQTTDMIHFSSPEDLKFDRPGTPENINSSRLLLLDFNSVKKSHKKDKRSKTTSSFVQCHDYEHRKKSRRFKEKEIGEISCRDEYCGLKDSPDVLPKKKSISKSLHSSTPKMASDFKLLGCKNIDEEFKIHTSIKKPFTLFTVTSRVSTNEMSQEEDKLVLATSKEIDCSRCETPVGRCFKELKNKDLSLEYDNVKNFETDTSVSESADTANLKDENGRSTPINMSTTELLCNVDSIKKSHKKDKHDHSKKPILRNKRSYIEESGHVNFTNSEMMLEDSFSPLHHVDNHRTEKEICMRKKEREKSYKETACDDPQPSTSQGDIESARNITKSKYNYLNITPPNSLGAINLRKLLHTTSIKKSHKKERDMNAQTKYIFMSQDSELSDDGSIFDEADKLNYIENEISTM